MCAIYRFRPNPRKATADRQSEATSLIVYLVIIIFPRSRKAMGPERFEAAVTKCLPKAEAQALLAALAGPNRDGTRSSGNATLGGSREGRGSIRQHMLAAKRGKMEERRRGAAGIEDSEKVLWS